MSSREAGQVVRRSLRATGGDARVSCEALVKNALARNGSDNVSALVVVFRAPAADDAGRTAPRLFGRAAGRGRRRRPARGGAAARREAMPTDARLRSKKSARTSAKLHVWCMAFYTPLASWPAGGPLSPRLDAARKTGAFGPPEGSGDCFPVLNSPCSERAARRSTHPGRHRGGPSPARRFERSARRHAGPRGCPSSGRPVAGPSVQEKRVSDPGG
ncbi:unnamed protein product [Prorocentrum cordatum]|uniref:Protein-serine/threonine phosphatase n=1 Tax=Prorocentrum cordatum TaxID=2364126 RepID=A0ABN9W0Q5_9DINO|nr:unnamed protein product [Polarella glacialis]